ncbi:MAG: hypothetical protein LUC49_00995 [Prevotella sp.]|nr:hypothetical protein [Prevotella sp.]
MYRKIFLSAVTAVISMAALADNGFTMYTRGADTSLWAIGLSPDGRYMSCWLGSGVGSALLDTYTDTYYVSEGSSEYCAVTNDGMMIGYGEGFGYNPITGETLSGNMLGKGATTDGTIIVGNGGYYSAKDKKVHSLPKPSADDLGFEFQGMVAMDISDDGSLIAGYVEDWYLGQAMVLWHLNANGEYEVDPVCAGHHEGEFSGDREYYTDGVTAMSHNGRYIAINFVDNDGTMPGGTPYVGRYDMETGELTKSTLKMSCSATRIANDGTMLVHTGDADSQNRKAMLWTTDMDNPEYMADLYPDVKEFAAYDADDWNYGTCISSDGRYICGMAWHYIEGDGEDYARRISWLFDREAYVTGIHEAAPVEVIDSSTQEFYSLDGKRLSSPQKGLNIIRQGNKVSKVIVK